MPDPNLPMLQDAAGKLAAFLDEIVFVGGITLGLLITDQAAAPIRGTTDVDLIAGIATYADYIAFSERLRRAHFTEDQELTCRWHHDALTLDVLALNKEVLGFTNTWYKPALRHALPITLPGGPRIRIITAPCFWQQKWKLFGVEAGRITRQVTIWKTLWRSSKDARVLFAKSNNPPGTFETICPGLRNSFWRSPDS